MINNADFWTSIASIINDGFTSEGLQKLERYAEQFISREIVYKRFSPLEQYGCAAGGTTHVIATLLAGAKTDADTLTSGISDFKRMCKRGAEQAERIEHWANTVGIWFDNIELTLSDILGEKIAEGGERISEENINDFMRNMGFQLYNARNWTYATPEIYLSDMHDENVICSPSGTIFVIDCDIRINAPELRCGGIRNLTTEIEFVKGNQ